METVVDIIMVTYNQENYIAKAIESVLMQKTNFNTCLIIGDDSSTDNTYEICKKYKDENLDKIKVVQTKSNLGLLGNYKNTIEQSESKYLTILEGDDFWDDENKIQKQFDYLESNLSVGLVHTNCDLIYEDGSVTKGSHGGRHKGRIKNGIVFMDLLEDNYVRPLTVMFRKKLYDNYCSIDEYISLGYKTFDYPLWLDISPNCEFHYLNYSSAKYRIHGNSISHSNQYSKTVDFIDSTYKIKINSLNKIDKPDLVRRAKNRFILDRLTLALRFKEEKDVNLLKNELKIFNLKSLIIKGFTLSQPLISLYQILLKIRLKLI